MFIMHEGARTPCDPIELHARLQNRSVHVDVGTGSGRYVMHRARSERERVFLGIDPVAEAMRDYARRAHRMGLDNALYVVAAIEHPPEELLGLATSVSVWLPWGSLRDGLVQADAPILHNLRALALPGAALSMLIGYDAAREGAKIKKRALPLLSAELFRSLRAAYLASGIRLGDAVPVAAHALRGYDTDWAQRLSHGAARLSYHVEGRFV